MNITIFGTCRLDSLKECNNRIKNEISYTYDTKEILEVIKFIKYNHILPEETITTFRTPMITKKPIYQSDFDGIFEKTDIFIIEICGKKTYKYNNFFVHSALSNFSNELISEQIVINEQSDEEIEKDIVDIIYELNKEKKIIIVSHIITDQKSERYKLSKILEHICLKYNLLFINPVVEIEKKGHNINDLVINNEKKIYHYNDKGHAIMKEIYDKYINICCNK
jgi:hypothetical protein